MILIPNKTIVENNSSFTIDCVLLANCSNEVEFLFRTPLNDTFERIQKTPSRRKNEFLWVSSLQRTSTRINIGEYVCRISNNSERNFYINMKCM